MEIVLTQSYHRSQNAVLYSQMLCPCNESVVILSVVASIDHCTWQVKLLERSQHGLAAD